MQNQVEKAIKLAKKTGDRVIVVDKQCPEDAFVVMGLDEYEKIVIGRSDVRNLTEDELLDKINRDVAVWRSENNDNEWENNQVIDEQNIFRPRDSIGDSYMDKDMMDVDAGEEDNMYYYEDNPIASGISADNYFGKEKNEKTKRKNIWKIPSEVKEGAEEVI